ncbi:MAG: DUF1351 domain-containing protein [Clostridia bacterium]|nr:DUF1351 domain-containing protein [Clostridia bacterium]
MNDNQELIQKPILNNDIQVKLESLGKITSNIEEVKKFAINLKDYYSNIVFSEESISIAKDEKAKINKLKTEISTYRKNIENQFNEPLQKFKELEKETENILSDTYDVINNQVISYENKLKVEKEKQVKEYFEELKKVSKIDFIRFEQAKINVTLTASMKSLKEQVNNFIDKISNDLQLIHLQQYKEEILVEYKQNLDASKAITTVLNRKEMLKRELEIKEKQEQQRKELEKNLSNFKETENTKNEVEILEAPKEEIIEVKELEMFSVSFQAKATLENLKLLKKFAKENGIELIQINKESKELTLNVLYEEDEYVGETRQKISNDEENIYFSVSNLDECPEDAIIDRDLFIADDYINALNKGIELAEKGYTKVTGNYIKDEEEE